MIRPANGQTGSWEATARDQRTGTHASASPPDLAFRYGRHTYGLHGKLIAKPGQRGALIALLLEGTGAGAMPGCRLYVVSEVGSEPDSIAITEVWDDKAAHDASLQLERVRATIAKARPLIAGMGESVELRPIGGQGLG